MKMHFYFFPFFILFFSISNLFAQENKITRADPAVNKIIPSSAKIEKVASGFGFTEGPVWSPEGFLLFSDIPNSTIVKWEPGGKVSDFLKPSGKANGLTFDDQGRLVMCEHENRRISRMENGKVVVVAEKYEGQRFNSPNDLVLNSNGDIYFTDPPWGLPKLEDDPARETNFNGVYRIHNGQVQLLVDSLFRPNGIVFSPDERFLYIGNFQDKREMWIRYEVNNDGSLQNPHNFFEATHHPVRGNPDGMKVDVEGNLYATGPGGLWIISPEGKHLGTIEFPELPSNCAWGDEDKKTLYVTARTSVYKIRLNIEGVAP